MRIEYSKNAAKALQKMERGLRQRIHEAIIGLTQTPPKGDIKPMEGKPEGRFRLRVGGYRVIYRYDADGTMTVLYIIDVGPRGDIYK
ncbi:MAG: type II toxin-antitoxin system RelE/ParE family toxin [Clostridia bacterium]|nr:type II toxin-antitoxin system RelE/ParE family toxin [Clostridia bacterium]